MTRLKCILTIPPYLLAMALSGYIAWKAAPDIESALFPAVTDTYLMPYDPAQPDVLVSQQLDRVCWRIHFHKARDVTTWRRAVSIIGLDGTRHFSETIDARTGFLMSNSNTRPGGYTGDYAICAILPDDFDATQGYEVEVYTQYLPRHGLWLIEQTLPLVVVPPSVRGPA